MTLLIGFATLLDTFTFAIDRHFSSIVSHSRFLIRERLASLVIPPILFRPTRASAASDKETR